MIDRNLGRAGTSRVLPPGQRDADSKRRFGTHLHCPPPDLPEHPALALRVLGEPEASIPMTALLELPRLRIRADFHCVAGWSATDLEWEGVPFVTFWSQVIGPMLPLEGLDPSHLVLVRLDDYRCVVDLRDALTDNVLLADTLDDEPLDRDQGGPIRFVSPDQYGFVSTKHLTAIKVHAGEPRENFGAASRLARNLMIRPLFARHPRSRVWSNERNGQLPTWLVLPIYRAIAPVIARLSAAGMVKPD